MQMLFGERLCAIRKKQGFTQERLAAIIGVAKSTITGYEKGYREPNILTLTNLAHTFGISIDELVGYEYLYFPNKANSEDEVNLLDSYRCLTQQGKNYINQTMSLALSTYRNEEWGYRAAKKSLDSENDEEEASWDEQLRGLTVDEKVELYRKRLENEKRVSGSSTISENIQNGEKAQAGRSFNNAKSG